MRSRIYSPGWIIFTTVPWRGGGCQVSGRPGLTLEAMSVYSERQEELEKHEFMMGVPRGRLAVTLDMLTDALVLVGQHGVYCQSSRNPSQPSNDMQIVLKAINDAKELIGTVMEELRKEREKSS